MTFQQLQYLIEAQKAGSISQAAKNLFVTPSSVSVAVTALEEELGYPVFARTAQGLVATTEGQKVLRYASRILENYRLLEDVHANSSGICLNLADHDVLSAAFARLIREIPKGQVNFTVTGDPLDTALQKLLVNEIELDVRFVYTMVSRKVEIKAENQGLAWQILATVPAAARVGPGHRLYNAASVTPRELEQETMIEPATRYFSKSNLLKGFMNIDPNKTIASANSSVRRHMLSEGLGYFIVPLVPDELDRRFEMHRVPIEGLSYHLYVIHNPRYPQRPEVTRFLELLQQTLQTEL